jgi:DNA polymerase III sliding clamp (beta) subunit (PCNA family)
MSGQIEIGVLENTLTLKSSKTKVEIETIKPSPRKFFAPEELRELPLAPVQDLLKFVSMASDPNKAAFMGGVVFIETLTSGLFEDEKVTGLSAMGTDGKRCAFSDIPLDGGDQFKFMIPLAAISAIQNLGGDTLQIGETDSSYYLKSSQTTIYANKLSKQAPDYRALVPKKFSFEVVLKAEELKQILHTVEPMLGDEEHKPVSVHFLDGKLKVSTGTAGSGAEDEIEVKHEGEFKTRLNHKHLSDYVSAVSGDITFKANTPTTPVVLEAGNRNLMMVALGAGK